MKTLCARVSAVFALLLSAPSLLATSPGKYDGSAEWFWRDFSIVVARAVSFDPDHETAKLEVLGVLATSHPVWQTMHVKYVHQRGWSYIFAPKSGELYILCVYRQRSSWKLFDSTFTFMESGRGAEKIDSLADKKVASTVERIRRTRELSRVAPTTAPATEMKEDQ